MMQTRLLPWLPWGVLLVGLGTLAVAAAPVTWHLAGDAAVPQDGMGAPPPVAPVTVPPVDVAPVLALAPFGRADAPEVAQAAPVAVDLVLLGIVSRDDPAESIALINADGRQANFKPGNKIGETIILDQVNADHVVLLVDGTRQVLGFPNADPVVLEDGTAPAATNPNSVDDLLAAALAPPATEEYAEPPPPPPPVTTQDYIDLWRARITANPMQVLDEIGLVPGADGYTISENHDSGVSRAGLQAGDLVKSVNGQPVGNVDQDRALYDEVANSGLARLEIERDGRSIVLSFPLK